MQAVIKEETMTITSRHYTYVKNIVGGFSEQLLIYFP